MAGNGKKVLLHACCGPCSIMCIQSLRDEGYDVTGYFANPNIHPVSEYFRRREAMEQVAEQMDLPMLWQDDVYDLPGWLKMVHDLGIADNQGYARCGYCYESRLALTCGTFIMSSNAISADGQLVNIDGNANRVAALCFGPESVLVIAGMNKVMGDLDSAIARARQVAAPANAQRFDIKTPCAVTGSCGDCTSSDCICCQMVITRACRPAGRIKVILVGEDLGF